MSKIRNILIFIAIGGGITLAYFYFFKPSSNDSASLVSSTPAPLGASATDAVSGSNVPQDFLNLLLSVKSIKLEDAIFADKAFQSLHDSSITLVPDGTEGRVNPFAPLNSDVVTPAPIPTAPATSGAPSKTPATVVIPKP
ncbi:MAG: hypothetical protein WCI76_02715 [bacterium]